jgi:ABC-type sugar transport system permease subunit
MGLLHREVTLRGQAAAVKNRRARGTIRRRFLHALPYLLPALAVFVTFTYYPLIRVIYLSLTDADLISPPTFVGLENYRFLVQDPNFLSSLGITAVFALSLTLLEVVFGMALGFLMNRPSPVQGLVRGAVFAPVVVSVAAAGILWIYFLNPNVSPLNAALVSLGLPGPNWLQDPNLALASVVLVSFWKGVGFSAVLYLAGLQGIPAELEEAAAIDGAGAWRIGRFITVPLLAPTTSLVLFISLVNSFQAYGLVLLMTQGGPAGSTTLLGYFLYEHAFRFFQMGYASAVSVVLFVLLVGLAALQFRVSEKRVHYQ